MVASGTKRACPEVTVRVTRSGSMTVFKLLLDERTKSFDG